MHTPRQYWKVIQSVKGGGGVNIDQAMPVRATLDWRARKNRSSDCQTPAPCSAAARRRWVRLSREKKTSGEKNKKIPRVSHKDRKSPRDCATSSYKLRFGGGWEGGGTIKKKSLHRQVGRGRCTRRLKVWGGRVKAQLRLEGDSSVCGGTTITFVCLCQFSSGPISEFSSLYILA